MSVCFSFVLLIGPILKKNVYRLEDLRSVSQEFSYTQNPTDIRNFGRFWIKRTGQIF